MIPVIKQWSCCFGRGLFSDDGSRCICTTEKMQPMHFYQVKLRVIWHHCEESRQCQAQEEHLCPNTYPFLANPNARNETLLIYFWEGKRAMTESLLFFIIKKWASSAEVLLGFVQATTVEQCAIWSWTIISSLGAIRWIDNKLCLLSSSLLGSES